MQYTPTVQEKHNYGLSHYIAWVCLQATPEVTNSECKVRALKGDKQRGVKGDGTKR